MKNVLKIRTLAFIFLAFGCGEDDPSPEGPSNYWGCWTEATGTAGAYDIILAGKASTFHAFILGVDCAAVDSVAVVRDGFFSGDTLILKSSAGRFWCLLEGDVLTYAGPNVLNVLPPVKFVRK